MSELEKAEVVCSLTATISATVMMHLYGSLVFLPLFSFLCHFDIFITWRMLIGLNGQNTSLFHLDYLFILFSLLCHVHVLFISLRSFFSFWVPYVKSHFFEKYISWFVTNVNKISINRFPLQLPFIVLLEWMFNFFVARSWKHSSNLRTKKIWTWEINICFTGIYSIYLQASI
jgi:hypothetical protein